MVKKQRLVKAGISKNTKIKGAAKLVPERIMFAEKVSKDFCEDAFCHGPPLPRRKVINC